MADKPDRTHEPTLRYVLIGGAAAIAPTHIAALREIPAQIVGLSDLSVERGQACANEIDCPFFADHRALLAATRPDGAIICAPHPFHAPLAADCFAAGTHVLVEKPIAVEVAEADAMIAAADAANRILAVNFQNRFRPIIERAKALIDDGALGPLLRVLVLEPWYRPAAYYRSATWRGTWQGEGGGVLLNQAIHTIDLLCYLTGMPTRVWGWTRTLRHAIECEDTAQALLEYANGAPGYFTTSTIEPQTARRIEIVGERGSLELAGDELTILRFTPSMPEHLRTATGMFDAPSAEVIHETLPGDGGGHVALHRDLHAAIVEDRQPRCNGRAGRMALELANAIIYSSYAERPVTLPLDRAAYHALLDDLKSGRTKPVRFGDQP